MLESSPLTYLSRWHEHDPTEIVQSVEKCIEEAVKKFEKDGHAKDSIRTVGITNQRETTVCWDWTTGEPLYNAIVWTDTRTAGIARELKAKPDSDKTNVCGLPHSSYPSVTKLLWMLKNVDPVRQAYEAGNLAFGTVDAWLIYKLNGGPANPVFVSDPTNASRTMFMDIRTLRYSDEMLDFFSYEFDLRRVHMPEIVRSSDTKAFGTLGSGPLKGWSITGCLGDQSSALVGQKGFEPGSAKNTYGTGCFLLYNVGDKPVISKHGLLATVAYHFEGEPVYALEGSIAVAGSGVKFLMGEQTSVWERSNVFVLTPRACRKPGLRVEIPPHHRAGRVGRGQRRPGLRDGLQRPLRPLLDRRRPGHHLYVPPPLPTPPQTPSPPN